MYKKLLLSIIVITMVFSLISCSSGISQEEYDTLQSEKAELQSQLEELQADYTALNDKFASYQTSTKKVVGYLSDTYDGYRLFLVNLVNQIYGDGLSKTEFESYVAAISDMIPTYDEVNSAIAQASK